MKENIDTLFSHMHSIIFTTFLCCSTQPKTTQEKYIEALHLSDVDPVNGLKKCANLLEQPLKEDCQIAAIEKMAAKNPHQVQQNCASLSGIAVAECYFIAAELSANPNDCEKSKPFEQDCKLHLLSNDLLKRKNITPSVEILKDYKLAKDSVEGWTAIFRIHHTKQRPLDLTWCTTVPYMDLCRRAGIGLFHEKLNIARDRRTFPCDSTSLPKYLRYVPDRELDEALKTRKQEDLCP